MKLRYSRSAVLSAFALLSALLFANSALAGAPGGAILVQQPGSKCEGWSPRDENKISLQQSRAMNHSQSNLRLDCGAVKADTNPRGTPVIIGILAVDNHTTLPVCAQLVSFRNVQGLPFTLFKSTATPVCTQGASSAAQLLVVGPQPNGFRFIGSHTYISVPNVPGRQGNRLSGIHSYGALGLLGSR